MPHQHLLIPRASDEQAIAACWERFVQNQALASIPVRNVVMESWSRCRTDGVDPARQCAPAADSAEVKQLRERHRHLHQAARPVLEMLREVLRESGTIIMLADPAGTIIDLSGDSHSRSDAERINLAPGGRWVEQVIGTNAIGTAIAALQPVQIYASEHYCLDVKRWTCAAAPIIDPCSRSLLGVLDVSGIKETFHGHSLGLVIAAAKQIESALARHDLELHGRLLEQTGDLFTRYGNDCVILFDQHGRLLKNNGRVQLARELHGIRIPPEAGGRIDALDLALPAEERALRTPSWLQPDWLHHIKGGDGMLGTALVVPLPQPAASKPGMGARKSMPAADTDPFRDIIGASDSIVAAKQRARRLAPLDLPVMLLGETGVGKEVFAHAIHHAGKPEAPFVAVNCGALTRELLASELFGYAEGAYTGARRNGMPGKFELADGGTLFLDEIGEMPQDMQPHLLRVLQDGVVVRLGDTRERRVKVRIIAATNRDLQGEVVAGRFREDLFHRLCVITLQLPALRERMEDIDAIVDQMNLRLAQKYDCPEKTIVPEVRFAFHRYAWPGNIRELRNVFEAMFALSDGNLIDASQLPPQLTGRSAAGPAPEAPSAAPLAASGARLQDVEKMAVRAAIENANGNLSRAARALGISRSTLYVKLAAMRHASADGERNY